MDRQISIDCGKALDEHLDDLVGKTLTGIERTSRDTLLLEFGNIKLRVMGDDGYGFSSPIEIDIT